MEYIPVQLLHPLEVWESTDEDGKLLRRVNLNNFVSYLRGNRSPNDRIPLRQDKIWDEAQRHSEYWILQSDNSRWISLSFVITYMCRHAGDFVVCRNFAGDLEELIIGQPINASKGNTCAEVPETVLHLYKDIAKHGLKRESVENHFLTHLTLHFQSSTLIVDHKKHFSDNEWKLISLFELHFASEHDCDSMDYKELLEVRWKYLKKLRDIRNLGTNMNTLCRSSVAEKWKTHSFSDWCVHCWMQHCWYQRSNLSGLHTAMQWQWTACLFGTHGGHRWTSRWEWCAPTDHWSHA